MDLRKTNNKIMKNTIEEIIKDINKEMPVTGSSEVIDDVNKCYRDILSKHLIK